MRDIPIPSNPYRKKLACKEAKLAKTKQEVHALRNRLKAAERMEKEQARKERTAQVRERGILLERFLQEPELLTNAQVEKLLSFIFSQPRVRERLNLVNAQTALQKGGAHLPVE